MIHIRHLILSSPEPWRTIVFILLIALFIFTLYGVFCILFIPFMAVYNAITDKNKTNTLSKEQLLTGIVTERIRGPSIGQIRTTDSSGSQIYPAKIYYQTTNDMQKIFEKQTPVIIVDVKEGIAYVIENKNI